MDVRDAVVLGTSCLQNFMWENETQRVDTALVELLTCLLHASDKSGVDFDNAMVLARGRHAQDLRLTHLIEPKTARG